jgi:hypothetical protein
LEAAINHLSRVRIALRVSEGEQKSIIDCDGPCGWMGLSELEWGVVSALPARGVRKRRSFDCGFSLERKTATEDEIRFAGAICDGPGQREVLRLAQDDGSAFVGGLWR